MGCVYGTAASRGSEKWLRDGDAAMLPAVHPIAMESCGLPSATGGHNGIEQLEPRREELLGLRMIQYKIEHLFIKPRKRAHLGVIEGVWQKADVDHKVRLCGQAVLKAKGENVYLHKLLVGQFGKRGPKLGAQGGRPQAACIDNHVIVVANEAKLNALANDRVRRGRRKRQGGAGGGSRYNGG